MSGDFSEFGPSPYQALENPPTTSGQIGGEMSTLTLLNVTPHATIRDFEKEEMQELRSGGGAENMKNRLNGAAHEEFHRKLSKRPQAPV